MWDVEAKFPVRLVSISRTFRSYTYFTGSLGFFCCLRSKVGWFLVSREV